MRRTLLVFLCTASIAVATLGIVSFVTPICLCGAPGSAEWVALHFYDGRARLFLIRGTKNELDVQHGPGAVQVNTRGPTLLVKNRTFSSEAFSGESLPSGQSATQPGTVPPTMPWSQTSALLRIGDRRSVRAFDLWWGRKLSGGVTVSLARVPVWLPVLVLMAYPMMTVLRSALSRKPMPGFCSQCGYNLTGNVSGVCPECGAPVRRP